MVTCSNILKNFSSQDPVLLVGRIALWVALICSLPMLALPCRSAMLKLCEQIVKLVRDGSSDGSGERQALLSREVGEPGFLTGKQRSRRGTSWLSAASHTTASFRSASPCPSAFSDAGDDDENVDEGAEEEVMVEDYDENHDHGDTFAENGGLLNGEGGNRGGDGYATVSATSNHPDHPEPPGMLTRAVQTSAVLGPALLLGLLIPNVLTVWTIMGSCEFQERTRMTK